SSSRLDNMFIPHRLVLLPLLYKKACRLCLQAVHLTFHKGQMFFYGIRCNKPLDISDSTVVEHIIKAALYHISADKKTSNKAI
ncbi:hypothetical protein ACIQAS_16000, partial [Bacillus safensis]|uniref:hypothetical protein n=1 Tax=Bacillus safensis TaxID=561879 RepID=UPI00381EBCD4